MDSEVEKLTEKAENLCFDTNWCDLPLEMKEEVVKHVDFESSVRLRQTARTERMLVDSRKFELPNIKIEQEEDGNCCVEVWEKEGPPSAPSFTLRKDRCFESLAPFVAHILKVGIIDSFAIDCDDNFMKEIVKTTESIRINELHLFHPGLFDLAQSFVRSGKIEILCVFFQDYRRYLGLQAYQYIDLCETNGIKFAEAYDYKCLGRKEFTELYEVLAYNPSVLRRMINLRVKPNDAVLEIPVPGGSLFCWCDSRLEIPITNGLSLPTIDESRRIVFEVSEPHWDAAATWKLVTMRVI